MDRLPWSCTVLLMLGAAAALMPEPRPVLARQPSTDGIRDLADRLLDGHGDCFEFSLTAAHHPWSRWNAPLNDNYTVSGLPDGRVRIAGTTLSALARGLRHYASEVLDLDSFWFVGRHTKLVAPLPVPETPLTGSSTVPWRYNLNTVSFSYTFVWYTWDDWERLLDWAAWRGVNLQLAWVGYEKIFLDSFRGLSMTDDEIIPFFSGPAFQAWNRLGNIKGSWGGLGGMPLAWIEAQLALQKKIVRRMVELGITPVLPAFPGFVPDAMLRVRPTARVSRAPDWAGVPAFSRDYFLSPLDETYAELQQAFVMLQLEAFGNVSNVYTLDQFNELLPASGDSAYLAEIARQTYRGLTAANPVGVWLMQGWLFYASRVFWSQGRIEAYLGGVDDRRGLLLLDLYAEHEPQWNRTGSFAGRPWIWCQLQNFGGNMNLFGQVSNATVRAVQALGESQSMVGLGISSEAYEGNEIVYDLLLDQAWSPVPLDTAAYFRAWARRRYGRGPELPAALFKAWDMLRQHVYDNTDQRVPCAGVGVYQLAPRLSGLVNRFGHAPAPTALHYNPSAVRQARELLLEAAAREPCLWKMPAFRLGLVDVTRQLMSNAFIDIYSDLVNAYHGAVRRHGRSPEVAARGQALLDFLDGLDAVLACHEHFTLGSWLAGAQHWANATGGGSSGLFAFNARGLVTVWLWESPFLNDYSARAWAGLTRAYYRQRWAIFVDGLDKATAAGSLNERALDARIRAFERTWQYRGFDLEAGTRGVSGVQETMARVERRWSDILR